MEIGCVVKLRSEKERDDFRMTVVKIHGRNITCVWFNDKKELQEFTFPKESLEIIKEKGD